MDQIFLRQTMRVLLNYFLKGLLFVLPIAATVYIIVSAFDLVDGIIPYTKRFPGLGFVIVITSVTLMGYIGSKVFAQPLLGLIDEWLEKTPGIKYIYSMVKDFMEAFVGDKKKFTEPVLVEMDKGIYRLGFITQNDLSSFNLPHMVSVYCPKSYGMMGDLVVVEKEKAIPVHANSTELMKFIVSGGVTELPKHIIKDQLIKE